MEQPNQMEPTQEGAVGVVGALSELSDPLSELSELSEGGMTAHTHDHCRTAVGAVGLSDCRRLSDCRTSVGHLSDPAVGLSDQGSGSTESARDPLPLPGSLLLRLQAS